MKNKYGLYIHVTLCISKCKYCDFYKITPKKWNTSFKTHSNAVRISVPIGNDQCWTTNPPSLRKEAAKEA